MHKTLLFLFLGTAILFAKSVEPKVMRAQNNNHHEPRPHHSEDYSHSSNHNNRDEEILSSSVEISSELSLVVSTEMTSEEHDNSARMSFLDNNRIQITQNIAQGHGEYLTTLLKMMNLPNDKKSLEKIQENFDKLIYLSHNDFLNKLQTIS
jgi:hypothetical protein